jgi:hypothetical protein
MVLNYIFNFQDYILIPFIFFIIFCCQNKNYSYLSFFTYVTCFISSHKLKVRTIEKLSE